MGTFLVVVKDSLNLLGFVAPHRRFSKLSGSVEELAQN